MTFGMFSWLTGAIGSLARILIAPFASLKTVLIGLVSLGIPIAIGRLIHGKSDLIFSKMMELLGEWGITGQVLELSGTLGWFCQKLRIAEVVGILLTALLVRVSLNIARGAFKFVVGSAT